MGVSDQPFLSLPKREQLRTARHLNLPGFGPDQQQQLHDAKVLIVGAGGLGCPAMQSLVAAGVGTIVLYDDDTVDVTNLQRQILFSADDVGRPKVDVAAEQLRRLQPDVNVETHQLRLTPENIVEAFSRVDVVLDGSDNFATKFLVADAAEITHTPLVWATVLRFAGQLSVFRTGVVGLRDIFPEQPSGDSIPDCASAGVLGATTAVMGSLAATEVIKVLTGIGEPLVGKVLSYEALTASTRLFSVSADPDRKPVRALEPTHESGPAGSHEFNSAGASACSIPGVDAGSAASAVAGARETLLGLISRGDATALDVREYHEKLLNDLRNLGPSGESEHLALSELGTADGTLDVASEQVEKLLQRHANEDVVVYCASGIRSQHFVDTYGQVASEHGVSLYNLPGGVKG